MADISYLPGPLTAMVGDGCLALVETSPGSPVVSRLWQQVGQGARADVILTALLSVGMQGAGMQGAGGQGAGFALLVAGDDGRRLYCRGAVVATVLGGTVMSDAAVGGSVVEGAVAGGAVAGGAVAVRVDGTGLLTWREHLVPADAKRIILGEPPADSAFRLPAADGVVLASCVIIDLAGADQSPAGTPDGVQPDSAHFTTSRYPDTVTLTSPGGSVSRIAPSPSPWDGDPGAPSAPEVSGAPRVPTGPEVSRVPGGQGASRPGVTSTGPGDGESDEYDFLWGATQARSVGDAAVRFAANGDASPGGYDAPPGSYDVSSGAYGVPGPNVTPTRFTPSGPSGPPPVPAPPPVPPQPAAQPWETPPAPWNGSADGGPPGPWAPSGLIDAVPWGPDPIAPPEPPTRQLPAHRAPSLPPFASSPWSAAGSGATDFTIRRSDMAPLAAQSAPPDDIGPVVPALICPAGHVNPPSEEACRQCAAPLPADPVIVSRPVLGVLRLSIGDVIALDRGVVMGRSPRVDFSGADGAERPHVVKLPSADGEISRTHLRVSLEGWHVLVTDLNSTNGTLVTLPGRDPEQLRPGEQVPIRPGTVVRLAEGIDFRYEVTQ